MILQIARTEVEQPRISLNQLGEFPFATDNKKLQILRNQKYGNPFPSFYYSSAYHAILRSFKQGTFSREILEIEIGKIELPRDITANRRAKLLNNIWALSNFIEIGDSANPSSGTHRIIRQNALVPIDGVVVSARPEIITENLEGQDFAFTKLRFSKSKTSADAQEIALLALLYYGQQQAHDSMSFSLEKSKLIDCFSRTIVHGHAIGRHRHQQLHQALSEICALWPTITQA